MKKRTAVLIAVLVTALLLLTLAPLYGQPAAESPDQGDSLSWNDACCQIFAIVGSLFRFEHDPRWVDASFPVPAAFTLPHTRSSSPVTRAPPA